MESGNGSCASGQKVLVSEDDWLAYLREVFGFNVRVLSSGREVLDGSELKRAVKSLQENPNANVAAHAKPVEKSWWQLKRKPWEVRKRKKKQDLKEKKAKRKRSRRR